MKRITYIILLILLCASCNKEEVFSTELPPTLVFVQMADTQIGFKDYQKEMDNFRMAVDEINELNPDFVVICGDLVNVAGDEVYADFLEVKAMLNVPVYLVAGNHDIGNTPTASTLAYYRDKIGADYYDFSVKGFNFIVTNTQLWNRGSEVEQSLHRNWFDNVMDAQFEGTSFVLGHYNTAYIDSTSQQYLLNRMVERKSIAYLSGHAHRTIIEEYEGVQLVSARSIGYSFEDGIEGYRIWTVSKDSVHHELKTIDNE
jgi:serine/threonine-protein phosphatase CPPED1